MSNLVFRPRALALAIALAASGAVCLLWPTPPRAVSSLHSYDLAPGPLADTLARIARDSGQVLSAAPGLVEGRQAPAIRGG